TLPGIAGIILSIGMAVDANVVIFSRIREEIISGKSVRVAVQTGFKRAMSTVVDSQVTTFIAAIILYQVGTSSVKGFAWTLMIGILASLFTAVVVTQLYLGILSESKKFTKKSFYGIK
ncbi:MMPL family transporter, partial [Pseudomonas aeruginosa]|nr:MMPL family transporter [Pseudomonas aeruginosa]